MRETGATNQKEKNPQNPNLEEFHVVIVVSLQNLERKKKRKSVIQEYLPDERERERLLASWEI